MPSINIFGNPGAEFGFEVVKIPEPTKKGSVTLLMLYLRF